MAAVYRVTKEPSAATNQDKLLLYELLYLNYLTREFLHEVFFAAAPGELPLSFVKDTEPQPPDKTLVESPQEVRSNVLFTQVSQGEVTSVSDEQVIVRFRLEDDLEDRRFDVSELSQPLREGQAVQAHAHLELIPPKSPLTDEQIRDYEAEYDDLDKELKEAQLREDTKEDRKG